MWQLHWIISFIPDSLLNWIYIAVILAGLTGVAAGWLAKWIPFYGRYAQLLKPLGIVLIVLGVYLKGGYDTEMSWRGKVKEAEERAEIAEKKAVETNVKIETKIVEKVKVVKENTIVYRDRIKEVEKLIDAKCEVAPEAIDIHNAAAKNKKPEGNK